MSVVLGGGIGGLSTAFYLVNRSKNKISLFESSGRVGGWIRSELNENNTLFEQGPRTVRPVGERGATTLELVEMLNLNRSVKPILKSHSSAKNRMIYFKNELHCLPNSFSALFKKSPPFSKPIIAALIQDLRADKRNVSDESIYEFVERRLGKELADLAISPLICGICAGDAKEISVKFLMKNLFDLEQKHGGIVKGLIKSSFGGKNRALTETNSELFKRSKSEKWSVWSLENGLETLPKTLFQFLNEKIDCNLNSSCDNIKFNDKSVEIQVNGKQLQVDHIYSTIPSYQLSKILDNQHKTLKDKLNSIQFVNVAVVNLEFSQNVLDKNGFGFLVPPKENLSVLGVIFDTCSFPQDDKTVLTVMMGGKWFEEQFGSNPTKEMLLSNALKHVKNILKVQAKPVSFKVSILKNCIPQYIVGHYERVEEIRQYIRTNKLPITLIGSSYDGVGINDVIFSSKTNVLARHQDTS